MISFRCDSLGTAMAQEHVRAPLCCKNGASERSSATEARTGAAFHLAVDISARPGQGAAFEPLQSLHATEVSPPPARVICKPVKPWPPLGQACPRAPKMGPAADRPESLLVEPDVPDIDGIARMFIQEHVVERLQRLEMGQGRIERRLIDVFDHSNRGSIARSSGGTYSDVVTVDDGQTTDEVPTTRTSQAASDARMVNLVSSSPQSHVSKEKELSALVQRWKRVRASKVVHRHLAEFGPQHTLDLSRSSDPETAQAADGHRASEHDVLDVDEAHWPATLKAEWPRSLELRNTPIGDCDERALRATTRTYRSSLGSASLSSRIVRHGDRGRTPRFVLFPTSPLRLAFDLLSVLALTYDLITIPLFIAWDVEPGPQLQYMQWIIAAYWTCDILLSFRTGYVVDGAVEVRPKQVAMHYIKGWFPAEFAVVFVDWMVLIAFKLLPGETSQASSRTTALLRISKMGRMLRLLGVARLAKLGDVFTRVVGRNISQTLSLAMQTLKLLLGIVYANHVIGCVWFYISRNMSSDTGARWTDSQIPGSSDTYVDTTPGFQYFTALHWSLTQMTPGSMQINAQNTYERMFNIVCLIFGVLFFSSLISGLSAKMMQIRLLNQETAAKLSMLTDFLREKKVHSSLAFLVKQQAVERMNAKKPLLQKDVYCLSELSIKLQAELHFGLCIPLLTKHPVFIALTHMLDPATRQSLCFKALNFVALASGDTLFQAGHDSSDAYILNQGSLTYVQSPDTSLVLKETKTEVGHHALMCEPALWTHWVHVGSAEAAKCSEVLVINSHELQACGQKNLVLGRFMFEYGVLFHKKLADTEFWGWPWPTDISVPSCDCVDIMSSLPRQLQVLVGLSAITVIENSWHWMFNSSLLSDLETEVRESVTSLIPDEGGDCQRVVHLSVLKLVREDGHVFALMGKWDENKGCITPGCKLPGTKLKGWEDPAVGLQRLLDEDLGPLQEYMIPDNIADEVAYGKSEKYGIATRYIRKIWEAQLSPAFDLPQSPVARSSVKAHSTEDITIYNLTDGPAVELYAWLSPDLFTYLSSSTGGQDLKQMLACITLKDTTPLRRSYVRDDESSRSPRGQAL